MNRIFAGETCVVAVGGNAVESDSEILDQATVNAAMNNIVEAFGCSRLAVVHGNGPQYGHLMEQNPELPSNEIIECTQEWIGNALMNGIFSALGPTNLRLVSVNMTRVLVDPDDQSFSTPVKGVGQWVEGADKFIQQEVPYIAHPTKAGFFREAGASPEPKRIIGVEEIADAVKRMSIVICGGGGGVPVVEVKHPPFRVFDFRMERAFVVNSLPYFLSPPMKAVVDKDRTANLIGQEIGARVLVIVTAVDGFYENYGKPDQRFVPDMSPDEAFQRVRENSLGKGSMNPKLEAAARFVKSDGGRTAVITSIDALPRLQEGDFSRATRIIDLRNWF